MPSTGHPGVTHTSERNAVVSVAVRVRFPTKSQLDRMTALSKDLDGAWAKFNGLSKEMGLLNAEFTKRKLETIKPLTEEAWRKK